MDAEWVVLGVLQLAVGVVWTVLVLIDRRRPPGQRRHVKTATLRGPTILAVVWLLLGLWWLNRALLGF